MRNNEKRCKRKLNELVETYAGCERLMRFIGPLRAEYQSSNGNVCLDSLYHRHLIEAFWTDIGGES